MMRYWIDLNVEREGVCMLYYIGKEIPIRQQQQKQQQEMMMMMMVVAQQLARFKENKSTKEKT